MEKKEADSKDGSYSLDSEDMQQILSEAMDKNAALVVATGNKEAMLKKWAIFDSVMIEGINQLRLREAMLKTGEILDEDEETGAITAVIPTGSMNASRALVVARIGEDGVEFASFFKEGLIKQHGAKHAIEKIQAQLS